MNQNSVSFEFSDINSIKPQMLAEALKNAKDTAQKIAQESGSSLGGLHRGNQGVFDITDKDPGSPEYKKIRLVSTVSFYNYEKIKNKNNIFVGILKLKNNFKKIIFECLAQEFRK